MRPSFLAFGLASILQTAAAMGVMGPQGRICYTDANTTPYTPYDEDTIVRLITEIYHMVIKLGSMDPAYVVFPPAEGHQLDLAHVPPHASIDPRIVSLMKRLPVETFGGSSLAPDMDPVNYTSDGAIGMSRKINMRNYDDHLSGDAVIYAPPTTLMLLRGSNEITPMLVLDIADNTVRVVRECDELHDPYTKAERDFEKIKEYSYNFYNWPAMSAPEYLQEVLQKYLTGAWIPHVAGFIEDVETEPEPELLERRRLLMEDYGWPDNFREDDWKREVQKEPEIDMNEEEPQEL